MVDRALVIMEDGYMDDGAAVALTFMALLDRKFGGQLIVNREDLIPYMPEDVYISVEEDIPSNTYRFEIRRDEEDDGEEVTRYKLKAGFQLPDLEGTQPDDEEDTEPKRPASGKRWRFGRGFQDED